MIKKLFLGTFGIALNVVSETVDRCLNSHITDWAKIKSAIRDDLSDFIWQQMHRNPMVLPVIMEV